jgi:hypothetical protein
MAYRRERSARLSPAVVDLDRDGLGALGVSIWTFRDSRNPWIRFQLLAARVVAARRQNAPVDSLESLRAS